MVLDPDIPVFPIFASDDTPISNISAKEVCEIQKFQTALRKTKDPKKILRLSDEMLKYVEELKSTSSNTS